MKGVCVMATKLMQCKSCGKEIAKSAKVCPGCGAKNKAPLGARILATTGILFLAIVIIAISQGDEEPKPANDPDVPATSAPQGQATTAAKTTFGIGEAAEMNNIVVELISVTESEGSQFSKPSEGNVFVLCSFEIINNSSSDLAVSSMLSFDAYVDDYSASLSLSALIDSDDTQLDGTVAAGKKMKGVVGYEAPEGWTNIEIRFSPSVWSGKAFVFVATK